MPTLRAGATGWSEANRMAAAGREDGIAVRCTPASWTRDLLEEPRLPRGFGEAL